MNCFRDWQFHYFHIPGVILGIVPDKRIPVYSTRVPVADARLRLRYCLLYTSDAADE